jgi:hypothetical protein
MSDAAEKALRRSRKAIIQKSRKLVELLTDVKPSDLTEAHVKRVLALERDISGWAEILGDAERGSRHNTLK